jgi:hypothetical protein
MRRVERRRQRFLNCVKIQSEKSQSNREKYKSSTENKGDSGKSGKTGKNVPDIPEIPGSLLF